MEIKALTNEQIEEFLEMPDAGSVFNEEQESGEFFKKHEEADTKFLDEIIDPIQVIANELDEELGAEPAEKQKKTAKTNISELFSGMVEKKVLFGFDDAKPFEEYTNKDFEELLEENFKERDKNQRDTIKVELMESLPVEMQKAMLYIQEGGTNIKDMFLTLASIQDTVELDTTTDAASIVRQYLTITRKDLNAKEIEAEIQDYDDIGKLEKRAEQYKPKLIEKQQLMVEEKIAKAEDAKKRAIDVRKKFTDNVYDTLKKGELGGGKLDKKTQDFLFSELTNSNYTSYTGRQTNLLGHLLEEHQFSDKTRYDLVVEATWLLSKPEEYRAHISRIGKNEVAASTVRLLKTEESSHKSGGDQEENKAAPKSRTIKRPEVNFFKRNT